MAAFEADESHLFCIIHYGTKSELPFEDFEGDEPAVDPSTVKLSTLKLNIGAHITMEYDYGAGRGIIENEYCYCNLSELFYQKWNICLTAADFYFEEFDKSLD